MADGNPASGVDRLSELLTERVWLLADGATGTNLFAMGLEAGEAPELWNFERPDDVRALHDGFIEAGSDIILTNSFGGTSHRLKLHGLDDRVEEVNRAAATLARASADAADRPVIVAGSMGPTGELLEPVGTLTFEDAVDAYAAQARGLMDGGADVLWAETISSREEIAAAAAAAARVGAPFCATLSFDTAGRTMMGVTSTDYAGLAPTLDAAPIAFGANCGVGASDLLRTLVGLKSAAGDDAVLIAKANAGIPKYVEGKVVYDGTPELMAAYAILARRAGARIIGGCCGTMNAHLVAMRAALEAFDETASTPPTLDEIEAATGGFSSATDGVTGCCDAPKPRRRGGRRRG